MTIKNLKNILPDPKSITLDDIKDSVVAVDTSIYLYKYVYAFKDKFLNGFKSQINNFKKYNIILIYIFDGKAPEHKAETIKKRNNKPGPVKITKDHIIKLQEFLDYQNVKFITAEDEAERECAKLYKNQEVQYILTNDLDTLAFGGRKIVRYHKQEYSLYNLDTILQVLEITEHQFKLVCIAIGTDYHPGIKGFGPRKSLDYIKANNDYPNDVMETDLKEKLLGYFNT